MRRGLLTVGGPPPAVPLDVGYEFSSASPYSGMIASFLWCDANPLNASGTITSVQANFQVAGNAAFALISPTNVVRSISATVLTSTGDRTYSVSLAGEEGDYIAVWQLGTAAQVRYSVSVSGVTGWRSTADFGEKPKPGDSRPRNTTNTGYAYWIYGTG